MRKFIGWSCVAVWIFLLGVGIFFPTVGAGASVLVNLVAWVGYICLFFVTVWGLNVARYDGR